MKAILVFDEAPKNCCECPICTMGWDDDNVERFMCAKTHDFNIGYDERPKACELIEINDNIARLIEVAK